MYVKPKIETLPQAQQLLFPHLKDVPKEFVLYGGTALALRYGHRISIDFDFFTSKQGIDLKEKALSVPILKEFDRKGLLDITEHSVNHIDCLLENGKKKVQISFINKKDLVPGSIYPPDKIEGIDVKIATPLDIMACKILALHNRINEKDYFDLAVLVTCPI